MWETIKKLEYRVLAKLPGAEAALKARLTDRMELPLRGLSGEKLYLTGVTQLREKAAELELMYRSSPEHRGVKDTILLDAWSSATIEGARTTVAQVRQSLIILRPKTTAWSSIPLQAVITPMEGRLRRKTSAACGNGWFPVCARMKTAKGNYTGTAWSISEMPERLSMILPDRKRFRH